MKVGDKIGITCCSNGRPPESRETVRRLRNVLEGMGLCPVFSQYLYAKRSVFSGTGAQRAEALMDFYRDPQIRAIFDISGGDIANEILPYLDFAAIAGSGKQFWGYSDLTVILNAIYAKTGETAVLYQIQNLVRAQAEAQQNVFADAVLGKGSELFSFHCAFLQGDRMEGTVVGGNIRCLLKLAGTEYFPELRGRILLLEARSGGPAQIMTYLCQLKMLGAFEETAGILLGTFTEMEEAGLLPELKSMVLGFAGKLPVVRTGQIGHGADSRGIVIGERRVFERRRGRGVF